MTTFKMSTGFKIQLLGAAIGAVTDAASLKDFFIYIYSSSPPASPDLAPTGVLLAVVTLAGGAYTAGQATNALNLQLLNGELVRPAASSWMFEGVAEGYAGWGRLARYNDTFAASPVLPRLDGRVGPRDSDAPITVRGSTLIQVGAPDYVDAARIAWPAGA